MRFRKLGLVFCPDGSNPLMRSHAMLPTPMLIDDVVRVFFTSTDADRRGRLFSVDVDPADPRRIVSDIIGPLLDLGAVGRFDMDGVVPISMLRNGPELRLYYVGFQRRSAFPYTLLTGAAASTDDGRSFRRLQTEPVLPPIPSERYVRTAPCVIRTDHGWSMWYIGGNEWIEHEGKTLPVYGFRHTTSDDGLTWMPRIILFEPDRARGQIGFGRPVVRPVDRGYEMFISVRTVVGYTISHATSRDGLEWTNWEDDILPAGEDWDSEMRCYGAPIKLGDEEYFFYNGNGFGRTGFGLAIREQ